MELIPFSGLQIVDFEIDLSKLEKPRKKFVVKNDVLFPMCCFRWIRIASKCTMMDNSLKAIPK